MNVNIVRGPNPQEYAHCARICAICAGCVIFIISVHNLGLHKGCLVGRLYQTNTLPLPFTRDPIGLSLFSNRKRYKVASVPYYRCKMKPTVGPVSDFNLQRLCRKKRSTDKEIGHLPNVFLTQHVTVQSLLNVLIMLDKKCVYFLYQQLVNFSQLWALSKCHHPLS